MRRTTRMLESADRLYHRLGDPWGFRWVCDKFDARMLGIGFRRIRREAKDDRP